MNERVRTVVSVFCLFSVAVCLYGWKNLKREKAGEWELGSEWEKRRKEKEEKWKAKVEGNIQ